MTQTYQELKKLDMAQEAGAQIQWCDTGLIGHYSDFRGGITDFNDPNFIYRIKPKLKVINLDKMVNSGIDMEFIRDGFVTDVDGLVNIGWSQDNPFELMKVSENEYRVRQNHPHAWDGRSETPLPEGLAGTATLRSGDIISLADANRWLYSTAVRMFGGLSTDIISFTITGTLDGYTYDKKGNIK